MNYTFKKYNIWLLALSVSLLYFSCNPDELIEVPLQAESSENFFNKPEDYERALTAAYQMLYPSYMNVMVGEIASDNTVAGGESPTDVVGIQEIDDLIHTPNNDILRNIWQWMYAGIDRTNWIIEFQDKINFDGKDEILAETRFLRAYYYFELTKWFGAIPVKTDGRFLLGDENSVERSPQEQVYEAIENDLIYASERLPTGQTDVGRATKGAAQALLGKVYLYQDKFALASEQLEAVINSGLYKLVGDYASLFEPQGENSVESVFEIQYTDEVGADFDCLQCSSGNITVGFSGVRNFNDESKTFDGGFGFNLPTQDLVDAFETGDARLEATILDIEAHVEEFSGSTYEIGNQEDHTGYYIRKYLARKGDKNIGDQNLTNPNHFIAIRYADVLLMAAEALNRGNIDDTKALGYLNQVRTRAGLPALNNVTGTTLTEAIYRERRVELAGEGQRFFDLVRTATAEQEMNDNTDKQGIFAVGKHELFPIPLVEIQLTGSRWEQNPGY